MTYNVYGGILNQSLQYCSWVIMAGTTFVPMIDRLADPVL